MNGGSPPNLQVAQRAVQQLSGTSATTQLAEGYRWGGQQKVATLTSPGVEVHVSHAGSQCAQ